ncbi:hypothetical protein NKG94_04090 [Micromonospora sp. M12]
MAAAGLRAADHPLLGAVVSAAASGGNLVLTGRLGYGTCRGSPTTRFAAPYSSPAQPCSNWPCAPPTRPATTGSRSWSCRHR